MENCKRYTILPELKIIIEYFSGKIDVAGFINYRKNLIEDTEYNPNFNTILDFRESYFAGSIKDLEQYINFTRSTPAMIGMRRSAILAITPLQTAIPILYGLKIQDLPIGIEVFSTMASVKKWVNLKRNDLATVEDVLNKMHNRINILLEI